MLDMKDVTKYLPSRHFRAVALSILAAGGLIALASFVPAKAPISDADLLEKQLAMLAATTTTPVTITDQDSDNDGLKDWEEVLWKTDPKNRDTDGDGTPDGEEVGLGRDPNKRGPSDKLSTQIAFSPDKSSPDSVATTTDKVARDLFMKYLESKKGGKAMDKDFEQQIVNFALTQNITSSRPRLYTLSDITSSDATSNDALKKYAEDMGGVLKNNQIPMINEMIITTGALQANDPKILEKLDPIIHAYKKIIDGFLNTAVPNSLISKHLQLLNSASNVLYSIEGMRLSFIDPVEALNRSKDYLVYVKNLNDTMKQFSDFYSSHNIKFDTKSNAGSFVETYQQ